MAFWVHWELDLLKIWHLYQLWSNMNFLKNNNFVSNSTNLVIVWQGEIFKRFKCQENSIFNNVQRMHLHWKAKRISKYQCVYVCMCVYVYKCINVCVYVLYWEDVAMCTRRKGRTPDLRVANSIYQAAPGKQIWNSYKAFKKRRLKWFNFKLR